MSYLIPRRWPMQNSPKGRLCNTCGTPKAIIGCPPLAEWVKARTAVRSTEMTIFSLVRFVIAATLILLTSSISDAAEVSVCQLAAKPASFDHQNVTVQGSAASLRETTSQAGNDYTTFKLQDQGGSCAISVFIWGHPTLSNNDHVRVDGVFETEHHVRRYTFYNEVEATKVTPTPR
jgi:hypothetical protein